MGLKKDLETETFKKIKKFTSGFRGEKNNVTMTKVSQSAVIHSRWRNGFVHPGHPHKDHGTASESNTAKVRRAILSLRKSRFIRGFIF